MVAEMVVAVTLVLVVAVVVMLDSGQQTKIWRFNCR